MEEFIVWDTENEEFTNMNTLYFCGNKDIWVQTVNLKNETVMMIEQNKERFIKLADVGKADTEGNKIYADSSVVEWEHQAILYRGYFKFDKKYLRYEIITKDHQAKPIAIDFFYLSHNKFKIIGTLQKNPELLKGESDEDN